MATTEVSERLQRWGLCVLGEFVFVVCNRRKNILSLRSADRWSVQTASSRMQTQFDLFMVYTFFSYDFHFEFFRYSFYGHYSFMKPVANMMLLR